MTWEQWVEMREVSKDIEINGDVEFDFAPYVLIHNSIWPMFVGLN